MPTPVTETPSRYQIVSEDLRQAALALQIGKGIADRFRTIQVTDFIQQGEDWAENQVSEFIGVPLQPVPAPDQDPNTFDPTKLTKRNWPLDFIRACVYRATGLLLHSEYFENAPNASDAGNWALDIADRHIAAVKDRRTVSVGAGRLCHQNPFMPPNIAPRQQQEQQQGFQK